MFGLVDGIAILEAFVIAYLFYKVALSVGILFTDSSRFRFILIVLSFILVVILSFFLNEESLSKKIIKKVQFILNKRRLIFRKPKKRYKLKASSNNSFVKTPSLFPVPIKRLEEVYTQELLPIKSITKKEIECDHNRFVKILEFDSINFNSLKERDQAALLNDFLRILNTGPVKGKLKVISKRSNLSALISNLQSNKDNYQENEKLTGLNDEIAKQIEVLSENAALDHQYLFIFEVKAKSANGVHRNEALAELSFISGKIKTILRRRGIKAVEKDSLISFPGEAAFNFYNRNSSRNETFTDRYQRIVQDSRKIAESKEDGFSCPVKSFIAPRSIDFRHKDYIEMDGIYFTFLTVTDYPLTGVDAGFLNFFESAGEGFDFDLIYKREDKKEIRESLKKRTLYTKTNADQMGSLSTKLNRTKNLIGSNENLLYELETENEFFYCLLIATISAESLNELYSKRNWLKDQFETYNFHTEIPIQEHEQVLELINPFGVILNNYFKAHRRNILSHGLKNFFPYTCSSTIKENGVLIGLDKNSNSPVIVDPFNPIRNALIIGATGFGKSFFSMMLSLRLRLNNTKVFIVTPIKGHEYKKLCGELDGSFISLGPGSKDIINILEIRPVNKVQVDKDEIIFKETSYLSLKIEELISFFTLISGEKLSGKTKDLLSPFLLDFYLDFDITEDNSSIYQDEIIGNPFKRMPTLSDLKRRLESEEIEELRNLAIPLKKFTEGNLKNFDGQTNVDLDNKFCVIDLSDAIEYAPTRSLVNFIVQNFIWTRIRSNRTERKAVLYEEIWKFLDNEETAKTIREIFKVLRGYYGIALAITQNMQDLTENSYKVSDGILNNCLTQIIFHVNNDEAEKLLKRFNLNETDYTTITGLDKGEMLLVTPEEHRLIKVLATQKEELLFETDGNKLNGKQS